MIKQLMYFLGKKWWINRNVVGKKKLEQIHCESLIIDDDWISFGYVRHGESMRDLL